jgi:WD40 repeat protein
MSLRFSSDSALVSAGADGFVHAWDLAALPSWHLHTSSPHASGESHTQSSTPVHTTATSRVLFQTAEEILAMDSTGRGLLVGGKDGLLRLFDRDTGQCLDDLRVSAAGPDLSSTYAVRSCAREPFVAVTAGWDRELRVWDVRTAKETARLAGPFVCGDAVDVDDREVLVASWVQACSQALQVWDRRMLSQPLRSLSFGSPAESAYLYCARFAGPERTRVVAGGSGTNSSRLVDRTTGQALATTPHTDGPVQSIAVTSDVLAVGAGHGHITVHRLQA